MTTIQRIIALLALLGLAACGSSRTTTPPPVPDNPFEAARVGTDSTLEVMTWNLETFPLNGDVTVGLAAQAIAGVQADIVGIQEIYSCRGCDGRVAFDQLVSSLDGWEGYQSTDNDFMDLGFLWREQADLVVESFTDIFTGWEYNDPFPRAPLVMQARWRDEPIVLINNHYKCCDDGVERRRSANLLLQQYVADVYPDVKVIILGDLNDSLTDQPASNVFTNFLEDTANWYFADLPIAEADQVVSYPSYGSHIDHILVSNELFPARAKAGYLVQVMTLEQHITGGISAYYRDLSDHRPVVLRMDADLSPAP